MRFNRITLNMHLKTNPCKPEWGQAAFPVPMKLHHFTRRELGAWV